jgi:hypothetical protein
MSLFGMARASSIAVAVGNASSPRRAPPRPASAPTQGATVGPGITRGSTLGNGIEGAHTHIRIVKRFHSAALSGAQTPFPVSLKFWMIKYGLIEPVPVGICSLQIGPLVGGCPVGGFVLPPPPACHAPPTLPPPPPPPTPTPMGRYMVNGPQFSSGNPAPSEP